MSEPRYNDEITILSGFYKDYKGIFKERIFMSVGKKSLLIYRVWIQDILELVSILPNEIGLDEETPTNEKTKKVDWEILPKKGSTKKKRS